VLTCLTQRVGDHGHGAPHSRAENTLGCFGLSHGTDKKLFFRQAIQSHLEDLGDAYATDEALKVFEESDTAARPVTVLWAELGLGEPKIAEGRATNGANRV